MGNTPNETTVKKIPTTIFHFEQDMCIHETTRKGITDHKCSPGEKPVAAALYKYGFMNLELIKRNIDGHGHKSLDAVKILIKMQKQGKVKKFTVTNKSDRADLDIYVLSEEYRLSYGRKKAANNAVTKDIPYILEQMAICQWHINILTKQKNSIEISYNQIGFCESGSVIIPSIIKLKRKGCDLYLCAVSTCRNSHIYSQNKLIIKLTLLNRYLVENNWTCSLIVILGESLKQIRELAKLFSETRETKEMNLIYTIDMAVFSDPLRNLYTIQRKEGYDEITLLKI